MKLKVSSEVKVDPGDLAHLLAFCTPAEFAQVWFEISKLMKIDDPRYKSFGEAMGESLGGARIYPFEQIYLHMKARTLTWGKGQ